MRRALFALLGLPLAASLAAQTPAPAPVPPVPTPPPPAVALDYDSVAFARQLTTWFYAGQSDSLFAHGDSSMQIHFTKAQWSEAMMQWTGHVGEESKLVEERWVKRNGRRQYWRVINATDFTGEPIMLRFVLEPGKRIAGVGMNPASQAPPVDPN